MYVYIIHLGDVYMTLANTQERVHMIMETGDRSQDQTVELGEWMMQLKSKKFELMQSGCFT
jgi:hypothetical protein